jgi:two-component system, cell cycle sensor histidine kinase DivJ
MAAYSVHLPDGQRRAKGYPRRVPSWADYYLTKPFEPEDLLIAVEARLKRAAEVQALGDQELAQTKEELTAVFRSELQEPLNSMYDQISMLEEGLPFMSDDVVERMLHSTRNGTKHLVKVVEDLMLLAQVDSGIIAVEVQRYRKPAALSPLLENAIRSLRPKAEARSISLAYSQAECSVVGVASYIQDILTRIIDNAIQFGEYEGHVRIRVEQQTDIVIIWVEDDGIGIEPEQVPDLFDPRQRLASMEPGTQHVGLGLAIANGLAKAHGGTIQLESRPTEGTTVTITLPANL